MMNMTQGVVRLRLREVMNELGWTQTKLAEASGISRQTINKLLRQPGGPDAIKLETLQRLSQATGREIAELLVREDQTEQ